MTAWPVGHCGARTWSTRTAISRRRRCSTEASVGTASARSAQGSTSRRPKARHGSISIEARLAGKRVLLTVGRLMTRKGQDMVLRALPDLLEDYPDLHYVMAGGLARRLVKHTKL